MKCSYCGKINEADLNHCKFCGGELKKDDTKSKENKYGPIFYNGYIVYVIEDWACRLARVQFWLGVTLVDTIEYDREVCREFVAENEDPMPFIFKLFEISQGRNEVLRVRERNKEYPAMFEIRRIENEELQQHREKIRQMIEN